jgi:hypothetical protein
MKRQVILAVLLIALAIVADALFRSAREAMVVGASFNTSGTLLLLRSRQLILIVAYVLFLLVGYKSFSSKRSNQGVSWFLVILGFGFGLLVNFPSSSIFDALGLYEFLIILSTSELSLTVHFAALLAAIGLVRLISPILLGNTGDD